MAKETSIEKLFPDFRIDLLEIAGTSYKDAPSRYTFRLQEYDYENLWEAYFECFKGDNFHQLCCSCTAAPVLL